MKKGQNINRPEKGSIIKVEPIRTKKDIQNIKKILSDKPLELAFFIIGINSNLRASDLLNIRYSDIAGLKSGDCFEIREKKTGKTRQVTINDEIEKVVNKLDTASYKQEDFLFKSQRANKDGAKVWSVPYANNKVKSWCKDINLTGNYGSHTLRKTWGYHQFRAFNVPLPFLMVCFNHSSQKQTLEYLCIENEEIKNIFMNSL